MRTLGAMVVCMSLALAGSPGLAAPGSTPDKAGCESRSPGNDALQVSCALSASDAARFRFKANFSGGHDDTVASMTPLLDGAALSCEDGSKTSLMGEDGDVFLQCRFAVTKKSGSPSVLQVLLKWSHAQYVDFELLPE